MNRPILDENVRSAIESFQKAAKDFPFWRRFWEMTAISLGVASVSFGIGYFVRIWLGVDI